MTSEPSTPAPSAAAAPPPHSRWRLLRSWRTWRRLFLVALFAAGGYGTWREYDFRQAVKEAKALGWYWVYDDPFAAIGKDWKAAFRKATWTDGRRNLTIPQDAGRKEHEHILRRLSPNALNAHYRPGLRDLSALKGLTALQRLYLHGCTGLTDVDALKGLPALQELNLGGCTGLTNVEALKELKMLQRLELGGCTGLKAEQITALRAALPNTVIHD